MTLSSPVLTAYALGETAERRTAETIVDDLAATRFAWAHVDASHPEARAWMYREAGFLDKLIIDALMAEDTRPRMMRFGDGVLLILRGANLNPDADPEDMVSIRLWIDEHRVISLRKRHLKATDDMEAFIASSSAPITAGVFVARLIRFLFARMEPVLTNLGERTDDMEERILLPEYAVTREEVVSIRRQSIVFHRYIQPQRDALRQMLSEQLPWLTGEARRDLQESENCITLYLENLNAVRERAQVIQDELAYNASERLNRNLYTLSVISALFLPLGFFTGLMGINIGGMPGVEHPYAFWLFCGALAAATVAQIVVFRKKGWF